MKTLATAALLTALASAALAQAPEQPRRGGGMIIVSNSDIRSTEPGINRDGNTDTVAHVFSETLVAYRADLGIGPALASAWTVSEDGLTYTFTIRPGALFHNNQPVTAEPVIAMWQRRTAQGSTWPCRRLFDSAALRVTAVETPAPDKVVFKLAAPSAIFLAQLANIQCNFAPVHPDSWNADGAWRAPIATGPFRLAEWRTNQFVRLERFDGYRPVEGEQSGYAGARVAWLDEVRFRVIPDGSAAEAALYAGEVDLITDFSPLRINEARQRRMMTEASEGISWSALLVNTRDPVLRDVRMRRAIAHALDMPAIAQARTNGITRANAAAVPRASVFHSPALEAWPAHDPARARALLREAGYANQPIRIQANRRYDGMYDVAVMAQAMLSAVGIRAELEVLDWATQLERYQRGQFAMQSFGYSARLDPTLMFATFTGNRDAGGWFQWEDPKAAELVEESGRVSDPERRRAIFAELHGMMAEQVPIIGTYYDPVVEAWNPRIRGYRPWPANKPVPWGVWRTGR
jgi:peptide/nickel transport system substrate-binding protein